MASSSSGHGTCCTSSATAPTTPTPTRACSRSSGAMAAPTTSRRRPRRPARRGRAHAAPRRAELMPVGCGQHDRPVLGHRRGARAQRHPRRRRHAVLDQRLRRARLRARLLHGAGLTAAASTRRCAAVASASSASGGARSSGSRRCSTCAASARLFDVVPRSGAETEAGPAARRYRTNWEPVAARGIGAAGERTPIRRRPRDVHWRWWVIVAGSRRSSSGGRRGRSRR